MIKALFKRFTNKTYNLMYMVEKADLSLRNLTKYMHKIEKEDGRVSVYKDRLLINCKITAASAFEAENKGWDLITQAMDSRRIK